ncbi:MAG: hypothetical protein WCA30_16630 [Dermatophilaceae bacterium]
MTTQSPSTSSTAVGLGLILGAGLGTIIGLLVGGASGLALGAAMGGGLGIVVGAMVWSLQSRSGSGTGRQSPKP